MKKHFSKIVMAVAAILLLASCGITQNLTDNLNMNQTSVVLSQKNFHVVKTVSAKVSSTYVFGIGGIGKKSLKNNAVADLAKQADLKGAQALVNITVKNSTKTVLFVTKTTFHAEGTVIEFDE